MYLLFVLNHIMAEIEDWEKEYQEINTGTGVTNTTTDIKNDIVEESEEYIKPIVPVNTQKKEVKENIDDYEKKWEIKQGDRIAKRKIEDKAYEGLDEKTKAKKMEDKRILDDASDFMGGIKTVSKTDITKLGENTTNIVLNTEKDFVDLAIVNIGRIKTSNKPNKFTLTYLKHHIDLLGPTLDADKLDQLIKDLTVMFNKKRKEESGNQGKKTKTKQPTLTGGKIQDRLDKNPLGYNEDNEIYVDDDDYYDDSFM